ncbi:hypothetical protein ACFQZ8_27420, partial [Micromonospora azadirachtae]
MLAHPPADRALLIMKLLCANPACRDDNFMINARRPHPSRGGRASGGVPGQPRARAATVRSATSPSYALSWSSARSTA